MILMTQGGFQNFGKPDDVILERSLTCATLIVNNLTYLSDFITPQASVASAIQCIKNRTTAMTRSVNIWGDNTKTLIFHGQNAYYESTFFYITSKSVASILVTTSTEDKTLIYDVYVQRKSIFCNGDQKFLGIDF